MCKASRAFEVQNNKQRGNKEHGTSAVSCKMEHAGAERGRHGDY